MYQFAVVGCGKIAERHAQHIRNVGQLKAVCDIVPDRADGLARQYGCAAYYSIDDLLSAEKDIDIVSVCSPNGLHAEHSIKSLQSGKHVLCEKPLCLSSVAAWQMIDTAYLSRKKLFVVKQNRYNEPVQLVKDLLEENGLGAIYSFQINCFWNRPQQYYTGDWKGSKYLDGGILYTQFSHFVDLLYWLLGDVARVKGFTCNAAKRSHMEIEDSGVAVIHLKSGAIGNLNYTINSFDKNLEGSFAIFGEKGSVKIGGQYLNTLEWFQVRDRAQPIVEKAEGPNEYGFYQGSMSNHHKVYADLIRSIDGNGSLLQAKDAIKTIEIIEKIYAASEEV